MQKETKNADILLIFTGGTICCFENENNERYPDVIGAERLIISNFSKSGSKFKDIKFCSKEPLNILSENMTLSALNTLLNVFKNEEEINKYKGVIVLHGTDTLSYTSSLLALALTHIKVPVLLVSAKLPLENENTNGNENFKAAVELIMNGIEPNVYAVYQNDDKNVYLHFGSNLTQCRNFSDDFTSKNSIIINSDTKGRAFRTKNNILKDINTLKTGVLLIEPYSCLNYSHYNLDNVKCVIHGSYHSETVCVDGNDTSIITFAKKCKERNIPLFVSPLSKTNYVSSAEALNNDLIPLGSTTEAAYTKAILGVSLGLSGQPLKDFLKKDINYETD